MSARTSPATPRRRGDVLIGKALATLDRRLRHAGESLGSPYAVREFLQLRLAELEHEVFMVLFLDSQNRMIEWREMFRGTVTQTSVYPREVVKAAQACNASTHRRRPRAPAIVRGIRFAVAARPAAPAARQSSYLERLPRLLLRPAFDGRKVGAGGTADSLFRWCTLGALAEKFGQLFTISSNVG